MKLFIRKTLNRMGIDLVRVHSQQASTTDGIYSPILACNSGIPDLDKIGNIGMSIPGMISSFSGKMLYTLCYFQEQRGDVVEIGSWQGRSSSFLAHAVRESDNGRFFAVDHFKGNIGKERFYIVKKQDLSDLEAGFRDNMKKFGLAETVSLLNMPSELAADAIGPGPVRFLFIDGDHTKEGVENDLHLFFPKLRKGSILVFDDFSATFPGLISAVGDLVHRHEFSRTMTFRNTLVLQL